MPSSVDESSTSLPCVTQQSGDSLKLRISFPIAKDSGKSTELTSRNLHATLSHVHERLVHRDGRGIFTQPVTDDVAVGYSELITHPIDLSTIGDRLNGRAYYRTATDYLADVTRMCDNAMFYNGPNTIYHQRAMKLLTYCRRLMLASALRKQCTQLGLSPVLTDSDLGDACLTGELPQLIEPWMSVYCRRISDSSKLRSSSARPSALTTPPQLTVSQHRLTSTPSNTPPPITELERIKPTSPPCSEPSVTQTSVIQPPFPISTSASIIDLPTPVKRGRGRPRKYPKVIPPPPPPGEATLSDVRVCLSPIKSTIFTPETVEPQPEFSESAIITSQFAVTSTPTTNSTRGAKSPSVRPIRLAKQLFIALDRTYSTSITTESSSQQTPLPRVYRKRGRKPSISRVESVSRPWRKRGRDVSTHKYTSTGRTVSDPPIPVKSPRRHYHRRHRDREVRQSIAECDDEVSSPPGPQSASEPAVPEPDNELLIQVRQAADRAANRLRTKFLHTSKLHSLDHPDCFGPRIAFLNCDVPGRITATLCPEAVSKRVKLPNKSGTESGPILPVGYSDIFVHCLTGTKPGVHSVTTNGSDEKAEIVPLLELPTTEEMDILNQLDKLKYNPDEPLSAGIHGPLTVFSSPDLARLSDVYGADLTVIEYAYSLLRFVEPMGRWARQWAAKRLDAATDGLHTQLANFSQRTVPLHEDQQEKDGMADTTQLTYPPVKGWMESVNLTNDDPTPPPISNESSTSASFDISDLSSNSPLLKHLSDLPDDQIVIAPQLIQGPPPEQLSTSKHDPNPISHNPNSITTTSFMDCGTSAANLERSIIVNTSNFPCVIPTTSNPIDSVVTPVVTPTTSVTPSGLLLPTLANSTSILKSVLNTPMQSAVADCEYLSSNPVTTSPLSHSHLLQGSIINELGNGISQQSTPTNNIVSGSEPSPSSTASPILKSVLNTPLPATGESTTMNVIPVAYPSPDGATAPVVYPNNQNMSTVSGILLQPHLRPSQSNRSCAVLPTPLVEPQAIPNILHHPEVVAQWPSSSTLAPQAVTIDNILPHVVDHSAASSNQNVISLSQDKRTMYASVAAFDEAAGASLALSSTYSKIAPETASISVLNDINMVDLDITPTDEDLKPTTTSGSEQFEMIHPDTVLDSGALPVPSTEPIVPDTFSSASTPKAEIEDSKEPIIDFRSSSNEVLFSPIPPDAVTLKPEMEEADATVIDTEAVKSPKIVLSFSKIDSPTCLVVRNTEPQGMEKASNDACETERNQTQLKPSIDNTAASANGVLPGSLTISTTNNIESPKREVEKANADTTASEPPKQETDETSSATCGTELTPTSQPPIVDIQISLTKALQSPILPDSLTTLEDRSNDAHKQEMYKASASAEVKSTDPEPSNFPHQLTESIEPVRETLQPHCSPDGVSCENLGDSIDA